VLPSGRHDEWRPEPIAVPRRTAHRESRRRQRVARLSTTAAAAATTRQRGCRASAVVIALASLIVEYHYREAEASRSPARLCRTTLGPGLAGNQCESVWHKLPVVVALRPPLSPSRDIVVVVILLTAPRPSPVHAVGPPGAATSLIPALCSRIHHTVTQWPAPGTGYAGTAHIDEHVPTS
jgi:hypothetical protein